MLKPGGADATRGIQKPRREVPVTAVMAGKTSEPTAGVFQGCGEHWHACRCLRYDVTSTTSQ